MLAAGAGLMDASARQHGFGGYNQTERTGHEPTAGHEPVCLVHTKDDSNCLCFAGVR